MIKNFQEVITQIKTQVPIQELISEFITVKKSGRGYVALCPFHDDHHPSLQIHSQKGIFKCFSCGTGGDVITFYALIQKKKWSEAIPELATKYGIQIIYGDVNKTEIQIKNQLYELNKATVEFFRRNLFSNNDEEALKYLKENRKLKDETIEKYEIGFALNSWDSLLNYLTKEKQYPQELIIASGLFIINESQQGYYDRFRNRIIFPIFNENNNVTGFGGRILLQSKTEEAKYINSPETLVFNKGQILYGLNYAKDEIIKNDYVILTEGYLDVITSHQKGLLNTVATLGTALTTAQARLLTKYTNSKKVCLCLDSDLAGKKAIQSIFRLLQEVDQKVILDFRVIDDLGSKDLDESLNKEDTEEIKTKIINGQKIIDYILGKYSREYLEALSEVAKKTIFDEIIEIIITIRDPIERKESIRYISHRLNIDEEIINFKIKDKINLQKKKFIKFQKPYEKPTSTDEDTFKMYSNERFKHAELELLSLYISLFPQINQIKSDLEQVEFLDDKTRLIKEFLDNLNHTATPDEIINQLMLEFNEYKHIMSIITDIAWRIETYEDTYAKNKEKILKEAKEYITWWVTNKQKMKVLRDTLKECKSPEEETNVLSQMIQLVKNENPK